ncbi:MAG TPA: hypothetical protein VGO90_15245, partial [Chthoniobacteraceae bacterium]|nr:hypothetical protein [Chthoniobacteraceae bacterium]
IWKFTDADDDGVAEKREVWFDGKTLTGCANDLHGPYLGPDGWIYWCKGAFAEQTYDLPGQRGWKTSAAHVFRARPDGSGFEPVFTAGMDNPVGLEWTPEGDLIVAGTFFQEPAEGRRDGLIHAVYGGVWGKSHGVLTGHPRTGELMPPMTHLGPAAPCGITRYGRDLLVAQFNLRTVSRHIVIPDGATYRTEDSVFLTCEHPDFHPTDVLQAPDGSVLVVDTGGWYKLCCPTSQLAKPDVPGGIYRMRKAGGEIPTACPTPRWTTGDAADTGLQIANLREGNPHVRRRAAEALGRAQAVGAAPGLLEALGAPDVDRFLFHSLTYALLQLRDPISVRPGLRSPHATTQAAALYALEQMPEGKLTVSELIPLLGTADPRLQEAAVFVVVRHRDWATELMPWFRERLQAVEGEDPLLAKVLRSLVNEQATRKWIAEELGQMSNSARRHFLLRTIAEVRLKQLPPEWSAPMMDLLASQDANDTAAALAVLAAAPPPADAGFDVLLERLAADHTRPIVLRFAALARRSSPKLADPEFSFVLAEVQKGTPGAAELMAGVRLAGAQQLQLAPLVGGAGMLDRSLLLKAFVGGKDSEAGLALLRSISTVLPTLSRESLTESFATFPENVRQELLAAQLAHTPSDQQARLDELERSLPAGDPQRGAALFQSNKASCAVCHPVGYKGGRFGPDLSKVGAVRTRRDLIEAIVFPSASFVRSFETVQLTRRDGTESFGIVTNQSAEALTLSSAPNIPPTLVTRQDIKTVAPAAFSLMPQGFDQLLTATELADLVAYLRSAK